MSLQHRDEQLGRGAKKSDSFEQFNCGHPVLGHFLFFKEGLLGNSVIKDVTYCLPWRKSGPYFYCSVTRPLSSSPLVITNSTFHIAAQNHRSSVQSQVLEPGA